VSLLSLTARVVFVRDDLVGRGDDALVRAGFVLAFLTGDFFGFAPPTFVFLVLNVLTFILSLEVFL